MAVVTQRLLPPCEYAVRYDCLSFLNTDMNAGNSVVDSATLRTSDMADVYITLRIGISIDMDIAGLVSVHRSVGTIYQ